MMDKQKLERMKAHLARLGVEDFDSAPPAYRLAWRLGIPVPPPLFASFRTNALIMGTMFGTCWGMLIWMMTWSHTPVPIWLALSGTLLAAALFGLGVAQINRVRARRLRLPRWDDYVPPVE